VLNNDRRGVGASFAASFHAQTLRQCGKEATNEGITGAVGIDKLLFGEGNDRILADNAVDAYNDRVRSLCDDDRALAILCTWNQGKSHGNESDILVSQPSVSAHVCASVSFPNRKSTLGMSSTNTALNGGTCMRNGAAKFKQ